MRILRFLPLCFLILPDAVAQTTCGNVQLQLTPDYSFAIGSSTGGSAYTITPVSYTHLTLPTNREV